MRRLKKKWRNAAIAGGSLILMTGFVAVMLDQSSDHQEEQITDITPVSETGSDHQDDQKKDAGKESENIENLPGTSAEQADGGHAENDVTETERPDGEPVMIKPESSPDASDSDGDNGELDLNNENVDEQIQPVVIPEPSVISTSEEDGKVEDWGEFDPLP